MATEARSRDGVVDGVRADLIRLHETWMELLFPRQRTAKHSVLGKWEPSEPLDRAKYRLWSALGVPLVGLLYPLMLVGLATRFYARRFDSAAARIGIVGVVVLVTVAWGALTLAARVQFGAEARGFYAVLAASIVAVVSSALAMAFRAKGGRLVTVGLAYPFGMTTVLLPPVVAALFSPAVGDVVLTGSVPLAEWLLDRVFFVGGFDEYLRTNYDLDQWGGLGYVILWFVVAIPLGWILGILVSLANLARPSGESEAGPDSGTNPDAE
ncbi:hypothetical protein BRC93_15130 [Halobacteriales archaeon QS_5_70_15]|nr:MAG: hypothetical protein BRC93_15130 [Halobacteriales archaeon QS_5_70_15]